MSLKDLISNTVTSLREEWRANLQTIAAIITIILGLISIFSNILLVYRLLLGSIFIFVSSFYIGFRFAHYRISKTAVAIDGCIKHRKLLWKGKLCSKNGEWDMMNIENNPVCMQCQTPLQADWSKNSHSVGARGSNQRVLYEITNTQKNRKIWYCPECRDQYHRSENGREEVEKIFEKHFKRIWESKDNLYSIDTLRQNLTDGSSSPHPKQLWKEYVEVVEDGTVSTECFH